MHPGAGRCLCQVQGVPKNLEDDLGSLKRHFRNNKMSYNENKYGKMFVFFNLQMRLISFNNNKYFN